MLAPISSMPCGASTSTIGVDCALVSTSTSRSSRWPWRSSLRSFSRVSPCESLSAAASGAIPTRAADLGRRRIEDVEQALFGGVARLDRDPLALFLAHHLDRDFGEVADHRFDVAADVADLGVARGLDLDERGLGQARQAARDLGLADAGRPDHQDILGRDFVAQLGRDVLPPPAIAQRDRHGALGVVLAHDIAVELGNDFARSHHLRTCHLLLQPGRRLLHAPLFATGDAPAAPAFYNSSIINRSLVYTQISAATCIALSAIWRALSAGAWRTSARAAASA